MMLGLSLDLSRTSGGAAAPVATAAPSISTPDPKQGQTVTITRGTYSPAATSYSYELWKDGVYGRTVTYPTFVLGATEVGATSVAVKEIATNASGSVTTSSNAIGPVTALVTTADYNFNIGALNDKLPTLYPAWDLVSADAGGLGNAFARSSTTTLGKVSSTGFATGMYLETGGGAQYQRMTIDFLIASSLAGAALLAKWDVGIDGYTFRRSATATLRVSRFTQGVESLLQNVTIAATGSSTIVIEANCTNPAQTVLTITIDGGAPTTITDTNAARKSSGRVGLYYTTTGAQAGLFDNITTYATNYIGGSGVLSGSMTKRIGRQTPANNGAVSATLTSLGLLTSGSVGLWEFIKASGDATAWPSYVSSGSTPAPSRALVDADAGTSAVYEIHIDSVDTGYTWTYSVQSIAEAIPSQTIATSGDIGRLTKALMGGAAAEFLDGCASNFGDAANSPATFTAFNTHIGTMTIRSNPTMTAAIPALMLKGCAGINVDQLYVENALPAQGAAGGWDGVSAGWGDTQARALITLGINATTPCSSITITRCRIQAPLAALNDRSRWYSGVEIKSTGNLASPTTNITIGEGRAAAVTNWQIGYWLGDFANDLPPLANGNVLRRVKDGILGGNINGYTRRGNLIRDWCSNAHFLGGKSLTDVATWDNIHVGPWSNPADVGDHPDCWQCGDSGAGQSYDGVDLQRELYILYASDGPCLSVNHSDVPYYTGAGGALLTNGQRLTGYEYLNMTIKNVLCALGGTLSLQYNLGSWTIKNITALRPEAPPSYAVALTDPAPIGQTVVESVGGAVHAPTGTMKGVIASNFSSASGLTITNCASLGATGLSNPPSQNETARRAYYVAAGFAGAGSADLIARAYPDVGSSFDAADQGCFNPDGTWNTAA